MGPVAVCWTCNTVRCTFVEPLYVVQQRIPWIASRLDRGDDIGESQRGMLVTVQRLERLHRHGRHFWDEAQVVALGGTFARCMLKGSVQASHRQHTRARAHHVADTHEDALSEREAERRAVGV